MWTLPSSEIIAGCRDGPLILASVSRAWCQIAINYPLLWSRIFIDQSDDDYLERIQLFLDRSGRVLLDIILFGHATPTLHLRDFLTKHSGRLKTVVGLSAEPLYGYENPSRMEHSQPSASFMDWSVYTPRGRKISTIPIPKFLRHVQLRGFHFDSKSLVQFTYFYNLESLSISVAPEPNNTGWARNLRFQLLRRLRVDISNAEWPEGPNSECPWIKWLECPVLADLDLVYIPRQYDKTYACLEACLLRFRSLRNLRVHVDSHGDSTRVFAVNEFQNMRPAIFDGRLEVVQLHLMYLEKSTPIGWEPLLKDFIRCSSRPHSSHGHMVNSLHPFYSLTSNQCIYHVTWEETRVH